MLSYVYALLSSMLLRPSVRRVMVHIDIARFALPYSLSQTGGWGSIEYGTVTHTKGQVLGGRWKPLHHW